MDCSLPGYSVHGDSPDKHTGVSCHALLQGIFLTQGSNPGIKPRSPTLQADFLPAEPQGKPNNTGVGSLSLLQGIFSTQGSNRGLPCCRWIFYQLSHKGSPIILEWVAYPFSSGSLQPHDLYSLWNSPSQNTGEASHSFLQGIFPTQGKNPTVSHCRWILYQLSHQGSPRILEWVAYLFPRGSSQPRNQTGVSSIAGEFFTS